MEHDFRFSVDINLSILPRLTQNTIQVVVDYTRLTDSNRNLSSSMSNFQLKIVVQIMLNESAIIVILHNWIVVILLLQEQKSKAK